MFLPDAAHSKAVPKAHSVITTLLENKDTIGRSNVSKELLYARTTANPSRHIYVRVCSSWHVHVLTKDIYTVKSNKR